MRVKTENYQFAHGKKPRGWGRWFFECEGEQFIFTAVYSEALRKAKVHFKECYGNYCEIKVCS